MQFESPNPHEYAEPRSPSPSMPQTSQMTLVETNSISGDILYTPRPSANMLKAPSANPVAQVHPIVSSRHVSPPQLHRSREASAARYRSPSPIGERVDASLVVSPVPAPRPPAAKKKAGRQKQIVPVVKQSEAPYRNTRSRSRSVEPSVIPPRTAISKKSNNKKQKGVSQLKPLQESVQEEERTPGTIAPISGTLEEEMDVEKLLVAAADISGITEMPESDVEMSPPRATGARQVLDTDDEHTRRDLHQATKRSLLQYPASKYSNMGPEDVLRSFNANLPSALQSRQSSIHPAQASALAQGTSVASSSNRHIIESAPQPVRFSQPRKKSSSSTESFPASGTRASNTKKQYEQVEKHSPYKPPAGTRAAQHALSR
jgi:hypothetical protein